MTKRTIRHNVGRTRPFNDGGQRIFDGHVFALLLPTGHSYEKRQHLRQKITSRGGKISYLVKPKCHFLLLAAGAETLDSTASQQTLRSAKRHGIPIVPVHFVDDCIEEGVVLDPKLYAGNLAAEDRSRAEENFRKGVIVLDGEHINTSFAGDKPVLRNRSLPKVWPYLDPTGPKFHAHPYQVAKFAVLKGHQRVSGETPFAVLEIHVSADEGPSGVDDDVLCSHRFCVFAHAVTVRQAAAAAKVTQHATTPGKTSTKTCRYCADAQTALETYSRLSTTFTSPPHSMVRWQWTDSSSTESFPEDMGSPQLQKVLQLWLLTRKALDDNVAQLVHHLWEEAVGQLEAMLSVKVTSISSESVEKADGLLQEICKRTDRDGGEDKDLEREFYKLVPQRRKESLVDKTARAKQHELVQLIRDILAVSEATGLDSSPTSAVARYHALGCCIRHLEERSDDFAIVRDMVLGTQMDAGIQIKNIFEVRRLMEGATFLNDMPNRRMMFHASSVKNVVGILSRGLLLPKLVDSERMHGPGDLGPGIYFADKSSTGARYAAPSRTTGTRMMAIADVALGSCLDTATKQPNLTKPPDGYDSVHGLGRTDTDDTEFEDDEYVVFDLGQQQLQYLVEFCVQGDVPAKGTRPPPSLVPRRSAPEATETARRTVVTKDEVLEGVLASEASQRPVQWGLQTKDGTPVVLKSVHVRGQLQDLAARVVIMQAYANQSGSNIEAKYVFPMDDMGAVCGFEAFIDDKHVVGVVKEKHEAQQVYRKAITEGHGAYLLDQEAADVFVISIGNLPAGSNVVIKITYVSELLTEGELIDFFVLGTGVPPWQKDLSSIETVTDDVVAVDLWPSVKTSVEVSVEMPFKILSIVSPTHRIAVKKTDTMATVKCRVNDSLDQGFRLLIGLAEIHVPRMWVEHNTDTDTEACMLTFYPVFEHQESEAGTVILLLDSSNSMQEGGAFVRAQAVALLCLLHLHTDWYFNVILFGSVHEELFPVPRQKSPEIVNLAEEFILGAKPNMGNTRLLPPLQQFFILPQSKGHHQSVFLISDGHLTDTGPFLLDQVARNYGDCRLFTFGIDSPSVPCNRHLMKCLAGRGAGAFEAFDHNVKSKWEGKVKSQLQKAAQPVLTDVCVKWQQFDADEEDVVVQAPSHLITLFHGARQVIYGFVPNCTVATLQAKVNGTEISTVVSTTELGKTQGKFLHTLAARAVIRDWEEGILHKDRTRHEALRTSTKPFAIALSKKFSVLTSVTSFVAVEMRTDDDEASEGPTVEELLSREVIDKLPYIDYDDDFVNIQTVEERGISDALRTSFRSTSIGMSRKCKKALLVQEEHVCSENLSHKETKSHVQPCTPIDADKEIAETMTRVKHTQKKKTIAAGRLSGSSRLPEEEVEGLEGTIFPTEDMQLDALEDVPEPSDKYIPQKSKNVSDRPQPLTPCTEAMYDMISDAPSYKMAPSPQQPLIACRNEVWDITGRAPSFEMASCPPPPLALGTMEVPPPPAMDGTTSKMAPCVTVPGSTPDRAPSATLFEPTLESALARARRVTMLKSAPASASAVAPQPPLFGFASTEAAPASALTSGPCATPFGSASGTLFGSAPASAPKCAASGTLFGSASASTPNNAHSAHHFGSTFTFAVPPPCGTFFGLPPTSAALQRLPPPPAFAEETLGTSASISFGHVPVVDSGNTSFPSLSTAETVGFAAAFSFPQKVTVPDTLPDNTPSPPDDIFHEDRTAGNVSSNGSPLPPCFKSAPGVLDKQQQQQQTVAESMEDYETMTDEENDTPISDEDFYICDETAISTCFGHQHIDDEASLSPFTRWNRSLDHAGSARHNVGGGLPVCFTILAILEQHACSIGIPAITVKYLTRGRIRGERQLRQIQAQITEELGEDDNHNTEAEDILKHQQTGGFFTLDAVQSWADVVKIRNTLYESGLASLGQSPLSANHINGDAQSAILNLCATLIAISRLLQLLESDNMDDTDADVPADNQLVRVVMRHVDRLSRRQFARFLNALLYVTLVDRRHPLVYNSLQLSNNWENYVDLF